MAGTLTIGGSITERLTSCLTDLDYIQTIDIDLKSCKLQLHTFKNNLHPVALMWKF